MASKVPCNFYHKQGYCAKGNYCEFLHSSRPVCKFYQSEEGCRRGRSCTFAHIKPQKAPQSAPHRPKVSQPTPLSTNSSPQTTAVIKGEESGGRSVDSVWGFDDAGDSSGVYFYGAGGTSVSSTSASRCTKYADIVGTDGDPNIQTQLPTEDSKNNSARKLCPFYISGSCRFGTACRNLHVVNSDVNDVQSSEEEEAAERALIASEVQAAQVAECGICLSPLDGASRGMLSNCSCVFCLECIRSWRQEGGAVAKASQVRLCPLCRTESFFIIPCSRIISDPARKNRVIEEYRKSLSIIPCKHFQSGSCPFGSSCFYKHILPNGEVEETTPPRVVYSSDDTPTYTVPTMLGDFIRHSNKT